CLLALGVLNADAQPMDSYTGATGGANVFAWTTTSSIQVQGLYQPSMFTGTSGVARSGLIMELYWQVGSSSSGTSTYSNLEIKLAHTSITTLVSGPWNTGLTTVFTAASHLVSGIAPGAWIEFT